MRSSISDTRQESTLDQEVNWPIGALKAFLSPLGEGIVIVQKRWWELGRKSMGWCPTGRDKAEGFLIFEDTTGNLLLQVHQGVPTEHSPRSDHPPLCRDGSPDGFTFGYQ